MKHQLKTVKDKLIIDETEFKESGQTVELDQTRVGRISRMDAMQTQQMALEQSRRRQQQILKIDGALKRIELDEYGYCFVCGEEISMPRMQADPTSTRCVGCVE